VATPGGPHSIVIALNILVDGIDRRHHERKRRAARARKVRCPSTGIAKTMTRVAASNIVFACGSGTEMLNVELPPRTGTAGNPPRPTSTQLMTAAKKKIVMVEQTA